MKKMIKAMAVCLTLLLALAGCGKEVEKTSLNLDSAEYTDTNGLTLPLVEKPMEIEFATFSEMDDLDTKLFAQAVEELTGVKIKFNLSPDSSQYNNRLQMLMASKSLPDIFVNNLPRSDMHSIVKNDVLVNYSEMRDELPNIRELFLDNEVNLAQHADCIYDGDLYKVYGWNIARDVNHGFLYRKDIFDKEGIEPWKNTEEFHQALKKLKEIYPDSTPLSSKVGLQIIDQLCVGWGLSSSAISQYKQEGDYFYAGTSEQMHDLLNFLHKLCLEGLLDPEFLTCTESQWASGMTQDGKSFVTFDWIDRMDLFYDQIKSQNPNYQLSFGYPIGPEAAYPRLSKVAGGGLSVSNNKNAKISAKLIDFLLSPAGAKVSTLGVKGISYEEGEDGKINYILPESVQPNIRTLEDAYGMYTQSVTLRYADNCVYYQYTPNVQAAQELVNENNLLLDRPFDKVLVETNEDEYNQILSELKRQFEAFAGKYILSDGDVEAQWSEWVEKAKSLGVDRLEEIVNENMSQK